MEDQTLIGKAFYQFVKEIGETKFYLLDNGKKFFKEEIGKMNFGGFIKNEKEIPHLSHILVFEPKNFYVDNDFDYNFHIVFGLLKRKEIPRIRYSRIYFGSLE